MPVTVLDLAIFRGAKESEGGGFTAGSINDAGLPMLGGCSVCGASIAAYNAAPSKSGYLKCASGCIGDDGYDDALDADEAIFGGDDV